MAQYNTDSLLYLTPIEHISLRFFVDKSKFTITAARSLQIKLSTLYGILEKGYGSKQNIEKIRLLLPPLVNPGLENIIINGICEQWGYSADELRAETQRRQAMWLTEPRQAACYLLVKYNCNTYDAIAKLVGYNSKQMVVNGVNATSRVIEVDMSLKEKIVKIESSIKN